MIEAAAFAIAAAGPSASEVLITQSWITALAGFGGALAGAAGAVFGPWWLKKSDRSAERAAARQEARRLAIIEWQAAALALALGTPDNEDAPPELQGRAERASAELTSLLTPSERNVDKWIRDVESIYGGIHIGTQTEIAAIAAATRALIAWHRGDLPPQALVPFSVKWSTEKERHLAIKEPSWPDWRFYHSPRGRLTETDIEAF